jgi:hypothetical protein
MGSLSGLDRGNEPSNIPNQTISDIKPRIQMDILIEAGFLSTGCSGSWREV